MKLQMSRLSLFSVMRTVQQPMYEALISIGSLLKRSAALQSLALGLLSFTHAAQAHEGHGMPGTAHWHSTDVWGFVVVGGLIAFIIWMKGRK